MAWDDTKSEFAASDRAAADEQITATEWNNMVSDQESRTTTDEDVENFSTSGSDGQVPVAQSDGSLAMEAVGGGHAVSDDGTEVVSAVDDFNLAGSYFDVTNPTGSDVKVTLTNDSVTVAGNSVALGGSATVDYVDLADTGASFPIPNADLSNDSVTVTAGDGLKNGGSVALGASTTVDVEPADFAGAGLADDGSDNLTPDTSDEGTITATGGSSPAADTTISTSLAQTDAYDVLLYVDADPAFDADYQFNYDHAHFWDDSAGTLKIDLTVNWDTDPGGGNDVTLRWEVIRR